MFLPSLDKKLPPPTYLTHLNNPKAIMTHALNCVFERLPLCWMSMPATYLFFAVMCPVSYCSVSFILYQFISGLNSNSFVVWYCNITIEKQNTSLMLFKVRNSTIATFLPHCISRITGMVRLGLDLEHVTKPMF